jgi:hypothetical protein
VVEAVSEEVDDLLVGDVDYGSALVEEAAHVLAEGLTLFLLDHGQVHASTRAACNTLKFHHQINVTNMVFRFYFLRIN